MKRLSTHIIAIILLISVPVANAQHIDSDQAFGAESLFIDANGVSWLKVEPTKGWSILEIQDEFAPGGTFEGFRYATPDEFLNLLAQFEISSDPSNDTNKDQFYSVLALIEIFGSTDFYGGLLDTFTYEETAALGGYLSDGTIGEVYYIMGELNMPPFNLLYWASRGWNPVTVTEYQPAHFLVKGEAPTTTIDGLIDTIMIALEEGTISGTGKGASASNRLNALLNMVDNARELIEQGYVEEGCQQLADIYAKCDGQNKPPDFITGSGAVAIAGMILDLMDAYGCGS